MHDLADVHVEFQIPVLTVPVRFRLRVHGKPGFIAWLFLFWGLLEMAKEISGLLLFAFYCYICEKNT